MWGTSLYSNDLTCDIRGDYIDKLRRGNTNIEVTETLIKENIDDTCDVLDEALFWYALADTQWNYGRLLPKVKNKAMYYLMSGNEDERLKNSDDKTKKAWALTLNKLKSKLSSAQPPQKKISKYRFYKCNWLLGDVYSYRFDSEYSKKKGFYLKYVAFRKISEDTWWPGHIVPVVQVYKWIGNSKPTLECLSKLELLEQYRNPSYFKTHPKASHKYSIKLLSESKRIIPMDKLSFIGNIQGDDLIPFQGHDYWTGNMPVSWNDKYNTNFEEHIIDMYLAWNDGSFVFDE